MPKKTLTSQKNRSVKKTTGTPKTAKVKTPAGPPVKGRGGKPARDYPSDIFSKIFDANPIGMAVTSIDEGRIIKVNKGFLEMTGYSEQEVLARTTAELNIWDSPAERTYVIEQLGAAGHVRNHEVTMRRKSGSALHCLFSAEFIRLKGKSFILSMAVDITEQVNTRRAMAEGEAMYRLLVENMSDSLWVMDLRTMKIQYTSPSGFKILGYTQEESLSQGAADLVAPDHMQMVISSIAEEIRKDGAPGVDPERTRTIELKQIHKNGSIVWVEMTVRFLRDASGKPDRILGVSRDITERKRAGEELQKSRDAFRNIVESSPVGIFRTCPPGRFVMVNPAMAQMFGFDTIEEFRERMNDEASHVYYNAEDQGRFLSLIRKDKKFNGVEFLCRNKRGEPFWVMASCRAIVNEKDEITAIEGFFSDITEQKRAEEGLKKSQEQLRDMLKEKEILLREIHHRVKNNMQIISSLLGLQAAHVKDGRDGKLFEVSQGRVRSMALVHEKLYRSESIAGLDFQEYITDLVNELFRTHYGLVKVNVIVNARDIFIPIDDVIPCSLIIYEMVTNALKHAFPVDRGGTVVIDFFSEGEEKVLRIKDDGVGMPPGLDYRNTDSLGLQLVNALAKQLKGAVQYNGSGGAEFTVRFRGQS